MILRGEGENPDVRRLSQVIVPRLPDRGQVTRHPHAGDDVDQEGHRAYLEALVLKRSRQTITSIRPITYSSSRKVTPWPCRGVGGGRPDRES